MPPGLPIYWQGGSGGQNEGVSGEEEEMHGCRCGNPYLWGRGPLQQLLQHLAAVGAPMGGKRAGEDTVECVGPFTPLAAPSPPAAPPALGCRSGRSRRRQRRRRAARPRCR
eukprot:359683-Chlamydomonas_euryale.AAC.3